MIPEDPLAEESSSYTNDTNVVQELDQVIHNYPDRLSNYPQELYRSNLSQDYRESSAPIGSNVPKTPADSLQDSNNVNRDDSHILEAEPQQEPAPEVVQLLDHARAREEQGDNAGAVRIFRRIWGDVSAQADPYTIIQCLRSTVRLRSRTAFYFETPESELERLVAGYLCFFGPESNEYLWPALCLLCMRLKDSGTHIHQHLIENLAEGFTNPRVTIDPGASKKYENLTSLIRAYLNVPNFNLAIVERLISRILKSFDVERPQAKIWFDVVGILQDKGMFDEANTYLLDAMRMCFDQHSRHKALSPSRHEPFVEASMGKLLFEVLERHCLHAPRDQIKVGALVVQLRTLRDIMNKDRELTDDNNGQTDNQSMAYLMLMRFLTALNEPHDAAKMLSGAVFGIVNYDIDEMFGAWDEDGRDSVLFELRHLWQSCVKAAHFKNARNTTEYSMEVNELWCGKGSKYYQAACEARHSI